MGRKRYTVEQTYYRWRTRYGGMQVSQAKRLKELLAESMLDQGILKEGASGTNEPGQEARQSF